MTTKSIISLIAIAAIVGASLFRDLGGLFWLIVPFGILILDDLIVNLTKARNAFGLATNDIVVYYPDSAATCYDGFVKSLPIADNLQIGETYKIIKVCGELIMLENKVYYQHSSQFIKCSQYGSI